MRQSSQPFFDCRPDGLAPSPRRRPWEKVVDLDGLSRPGDPGAGSSLAFSIPKVYSSTGPLRIDGCSDHGRAGWEEASRHFGFDDTRPATQVVTEVDDALRRLGWKRHDTHPGAHQGLILGWVRPAPDHTEAVVRPYPLPTGSMTWTLNVPPLRARLMCRGVYPSRLLS